VAQKVISDEELLLLSPIHNNEESVPTVKSKLTMKLLNELISKLNQENIILSNRINELELKLELLLQNRAEVATTIEVPIQSEPGKPDEMETGLAWYIPPTLLSPRSERHPSQKKKSFWSFWFHLRFFSSRNG
jgi:hypothetical protein